jgi:hemoglobin-like flavoprotein
MTDAELIEASLTALDGHEAEMRELLFDRFFARFPERRAIFLHIDATSVRMTDETLQWMNGLAQDRKWVWSQVAELVFNHRNYGELRQDEYDVFVDFAIDAMRDTIDAWNAATEGAWRRQAASLKTLVARARAEWAASPLAFS